MRFLVDTNVLVSATFAELPGNSSALRFLERVLASDTPWCLTWVNVYEYLRVSTHARVFETPLRWHQAMAQCAELLRHPSLDMLVETERHASALEAVVKEAGGASGNFVHDCHIAALMREHDVTWIVTADAHFRRFPGMEVTAPEDARL